MKTDSRRRVLRSTARLAIGAALGALAAKLLLRRPAAGTGYCDRAGRCGGCTIQAACDTYRALDARAGR